MKKLALAFAVGSFLYGQEKVDEATTAKMRSEELEHSQILPTLHTLTDRYGPRVTGSPNHEAAAKWAVSQMTARGLNEGRGYGVHDAGFLHRGRCHPPRRTGAGDVAGLRFGLGRSRTSLING